MQREFAETVFDSVGGTLGECVFYEYLDGSKEPLTAIYFSKIKVFDEEEGIAVTMDSPGFEFKVDDFKRFPMEGDKIRRAKIGRKNKKKKEETLFKVIDVKTKDYILVKCFVREIE